MKTRVIAFAHPYSIKKKLITVYEIPENLYKEYIKLQTTVGIPAAKRVEEIEAQIKTQYKGITLSLHSVYKLPYQLYETLRRG